MVGVLEAFWGFLAGWWGRVHLYIHTTQLKFTPNPHHSIWLAVSRVPSACARRWAQFRVGLAACQWGMEPRKESLAIKKIHLGRYNGLILKNRFCYFWHAKPISSCECLER